MAVEARRGCGYRKAGGLYLVSKGLGEPCERLPILVDVCPCCGEGVKQARGMKEVGTELVTKNARACAFNPKHCPHCVVCQPVLLERHAEPKGKIWLMWVGEKFYPTPADWAREAETMGVSKRVAALPKNFVLGKSFVFVAHPKAVSVEVDKKDGQPGEKEWVEKPGIFHVFRPEKLEVVVTPSMKRQEWVKKLVKQHGAELVEVPEDDPDHAPDVRKSPRRKAMERAARKAEKTPVVQEQA